MMKLWHRLEDWGRAHPVLLGFIVTIVGGFILFYIIRGGRKTAAPANDLSSYYGAQAAVAQSGNQLAAAQLATNAATHDSDNQLTAALAAIAGQTTQKTIDAQTNLGIATLGADVANKQTQAQVDISTLSANVQQAGINAQVQLGQINAASAEAQAQIAANENITLSAQQAQLSESSMQAQLEAYKTATAGAALSSYTQAVSTAETLSELNPDPNVRGTSPGNLGIPDFASKLGIKLAS